MQPAPNFADEKFISAFAVASAKPMLAPAPAVTNYRNSMKVAKVPRTSPMMSAAENNKQ